MKLLRLLLCGIAALAALVYSLRFGAVTLSLNDVIQLLNPALPEEPDMALYHKIVWSLRLPRALLAMTCGGGLALAGAVLQTLTRNPLADPWLLGISSGAGLGAVVIIALGLQPLLTAIPSGAFAGALSAFGLILLLAGLAVTQPARFILSGVAVGQLLSALTSLIVFWQTDATTSRGFTFWLLGAFGQATWAQVAICATALFFVGALCLAMSPTLNVMALGNVAAKGLGVNVIALQISLYLAITLLTATLVSFCGAIGFVGLTVPHLAKLIIGNRHQWVLPASILCGAMLTLVSDTLARTLFSPRELPPGVITALIGVPVFLLALHRRPNP
ncbi:FecCD family ABC transporter permease [Cedecea davisae]|uniref:FecCD family ABC transporter permease n=1 Tax=Cedecea davisae TaxID=158484 RepID=UPI00242AB0AC|nr:iron ABC transporter permease [Cedecea davisae]